MNAPTNPTLAPIPDELTIAPGLYEHYKGMRYEVLGTARHSETLEPMAVYRALYGEHGLWVRPVAMFLEAIEINGVSRKRFQRMEDNT